MKLLGNNALIEPLPVKEQTEGGIFLPQERVGDKKLFWRVLAVSETAKLPKKRAIPEELRAGALVVTPLHFSHHHLEDGTGRRICNVDQFEAVLEDSPG